MDMWKTFDASFGNAMVNANGDPAYALQDASVGHAPNTELVHSFEHDNGMGFGIGWEFPQTQADLHGFFEPSFCGNENGNGGDVHGIAAPDLHALNFGYEYNDMAHE